MGEFVQFLKRMSSSTLENFQVFAFGSTHSINNLMEIPSTLNDSVDLIYKGPVVKGLWRLIPIPKPKEFAFVINDTSYISELFQLLDMFLLITFCIYRGSEKDKVVGLLSSGGGNPYKLEPILTRPFILYTFDLDAAVESGMTEDVIVSEEVPENIRTILGIK